VNTYSEATTSGLCVYGFVMRGRHSPPGWSRSMGIRQKCVQASSFLGAKMFILAIFGSHEGEEELIGH